MVYQLESVQRLPVSVEEAWRFFSNPKNLLSITPPSLNLKVTNENLEEEIYAGMMLTYRVKPLFGIPVNWKTEITYVEQNRSFVDEQRKGPYKLWRHHHLFSPIEGGVEMKDNVHYELPFGALGTLGHNIIVRKKLHEIFSFRHKKVIELFGAFPSETAMHLLFK